MNADPAMQSQLRDMMSKAYRAVKAARRHLDDRDFDFASSRAYYAAFYSMEAALLTKGVACSTHGGVISTFEEVGLRQDNTMWAQCPSSPQTPVRRLTAPPLPAIPRWRSGQLRYCQDHWEQSASVELEDR